MSTPLQAIQGGLEELPRPDLFEIFTTFLQTVSGAREIADVNIAAGIAHAALTGLDWLS